MHSFKTMHFFVNHAILEELGEGLENTFIICYNFISYINSTVRSSNLLVRKVGFEDFIL